jgi:ABC-type multidrug transport system ATPase subunit
MSEKILQALLSLFAIIAKAEESLNDSGKSGRHIVERFLKQDFNDDMVAIHLATYDAYVQAYQSSGGRSSKRRKRTSLNSVKILKICMQLNEELTQRQKFVVLVRLLEFIHSNSSIQDQEREFVDTVAETFNITKEEYANCFNFVVEESAVDNDHLLYISSKERNEYAEARHLIAEDLSGEMRILHIPGVNLYILRYAGEQLVQLNGRTLDPAQHYVLSNGASIRPSAGRAIYYSDIMSCFHQGDGAFGISLAAKGIGLQFKNGRTGLHDLSFRETSGKLVGIMGGSGSGKSTLLNVLNGNIRPSKGQVLVNGYDIHTERDAIRGLIGHVPQDDLLIEELTVFQNLFYSAKLCFGNLSDEEIGEKVTRLIHSLGLYETKDLKVGNPLDKTISGGQRKRLNIALELIREPSILFVDEPTSGLSSRDSENIMELLKELALKGRIIFTVIHQPSSDIFKMLDRLLILDQEGQPVYHGDPVHAVVYFKRIVGHVNCEESQCLVCGNVNPEQIFNILEAKLVDEYGNETDQRRISPEAWNEVYRAQRTPASRKEEVRTPLPAISFNLPSKFQQFKVFFKRDLFSKISNRQYVLVNLLEAPALAFIMSFFLKFAKSDGAAASEYVFRANENLPQFLFISVIVSLFLGLTVSAEEIIRDRKILQREKFLDLSRMSYLSSKVSIMFLISAIQSFLFMLVANSLLGIQDMGIYYWIVLFSTSCFANVLGLNVSDSFNSAKVIYILIPVLIIPQLLFSGIIVKFDKLHPWFSSEKSVPFVGNVMASRWAYEALAVTQFKENKYERNFYVFDQQMKYSNWKKDIWVRDLQNRCAQVQRHLSGANVNVDIDRALTVLRNEIAKENALIKGIRFERIDELSADMVSLSTIEDLNAYLESLIIHYRKKFNAAETEKEKRIQQLTNTDEARDEYFRLLDTYRNDGLADIVMNKNDLDVISEYRGELVQKSDPIYQQPLWSGLLNAHFYSPAKNFLGFKLKTLWANSIVLWAMVIALMLTLHFQVFPRMVRAFSKT